jgi:hypothetical protein
LKSLAKLIHSATSFLLRSKIVPGSTISSTPLVDRNRPSSRRRPW